MGFFNDEETLVPAHFAEEYQTPEQNVLEVEYNILQRIDFFSINEGTSLWPILLDVIDLCV